MAGLNWFLTIRNLAKSDARAAELLEQLKKAQTDEEKEFAKQSAQKYIEEMQNSKDNTSNNEPETTNIITEDSSDSEKHDNMVKDNSSVSDSETSVQTNDKGSAETTKEKALTDLSQLAFTPRLAKFGITREEELFLHGVYVRKMTRDEKILMRRSIYKKKSLGAAKIQAEYKAKRLAQKERDANDPEKQKYHQERKYISAIVEALEQHKNLGWIFINIEGLTIDMFREFIKKPGNVNAFNQANPNFLTNFYKKYGE